MAEVTLRVTNPLRQQLYNMMPFLTWSKKLADSFDAVNDLWIQILKKTRQVQLTHESIPVQNHDYICLIVKAQNVTTDENTLLHCSPSALLCCT
jgi:hypothetical protein